MKKMWFIIIGIIVVGFAALALYGSTLSQNPKLDLTMETKQTLSQKIIVGKTSQNDISNLLGSPQSKFEGMIDCNPKDYPGKAYLCDSHWHYEQRKNPLLRISLDVYFNKQNIISGFELNDNY